ncbi:structural protein [Ectopseudomonas oleovorans]|uniref:Putative structural protein n=1 Tax=Ectopseudomonas oleovorans (strain CECT 5344) TaxID=1182590 RepID=W6R2C8_ECTO5|nr:structural protein [Pseudomonas oleovorans]CDM42403.1 putative structural protein [Pseudomonas oleovorans CECT 5344]CDR93026.1 putative structural protein [Pseudomonas oleovorans]
MQTQPRGIRNNNPGNIDYNPRNNWQGQLPRDVKIEPRFACFDTAFNGIRALAKLLVNYRKIHGLRTVEGLISRWAPSNENDTKAYAHAVAAHLGVPIQAGIHLDQDTLEKLVTAIIRHENGQQPYSAELIASAVQAVQAVLA